LRGGWLHTGDVGAFDAEGYLTLKDRSKDVIISGGSNIYPREVEEILLEHARVREVSVIGRPDPDWGEVVVAYVVGEADRNELDAMCLNGIARFKRPKDYVFVNTHQAEFDYPSGEQNVTTHYKGTGGVRAGSFFRRAMFALHFGALNILLSGAIDGHSKIMYVRDPLSRVAKVAPFLTLDGDPYPVIANGRLVWVVDAYTTTDNYPYSERLGLQQTTANTYSPGGSVAGTGGQVNYIRNSVKATVDAYDGTIHFYVVDPKDPIIRTYRKAFPELFQDLSAMPADLPAPSAGNG